MKSLNILKFKFISKFYITYNKFYLYEKIFCYKILIIEFNINPSTINQIYF